MRYYIENMKIDNRYRYKIELIEIIDVDRNHNFNKLYCNRIVRYIHEY